jgi:S-adenosylhomocysteine hydrolase
MSQARADWEAARKYGYERRIAATGDRRLPCRLRYFGDMHMYKPFDLTGKVALVTGGNGGIGLGMAEAMAASGADVVIWGTNETKNAAAVTALKVHGKHARST